MVSKPQWSPQSFLPHYFSPSSPSFPSYPLSSIHKLRENVSSEHSDLRQKEQAAMPKASDGYGGKFGVQQDRMDKVNGDHSNELLERKMPLRSQQFDYIFILVTTSVEKLLIQ